MVYLDFRCECCTRSACIAEVFIQTLFMGIVFALSLAFGLSFGLGGKEAASRTLENIRSEIAHH